MTDLKTIGIQTDIDKLLQRLTVNSKYVEWLEDGVRFKYKGRNIEIKIKIDGKKN